MIKLGCCRGIMFRLPFGTITASLLAVCGLIICGSTLKSLTRIAEKMCFEILKKNYLWFNDLKVLYLVLGIIICVTIFFNLILGFSATGGKLPQSPNHFQRGCTGCCTSDGNFTVSASNFFVKSIFILNYVLYYTILSLTLLAACSLLLTFLLHELCTVGKCINTVLLTPNQQSLCLIKENDETGASNGMIDLRQFSPIFNLKSNETELLLIKGVALKKLCTDFRRELIPNLIVCFVGFILLLWGFVNFLINISVNYAKISTKRKYAEILYINSTTEMMPFTDG